MNIYVFNNLTIFIYEILYSFIGKGFMNFAVLGVIDGSLSDIFMLFISDNMVWAKIKKHIDKSLLFITAVLFLTV